MSAFVKGFQHYYFLFFCDKGFQTAEIRMRVNRQPQYLPRAPAEFLTAVRKGKYQATDMLYSLMGLSPPRLLYGPAANYGSIIIPCERLCRPRSSLVYRAELALVRLAESWRTGDELGPQVTYPIFCIFSFQEGAYEVISYLPLQ